MPNRHITIDPTHRWRRTVTSWLWLMSLSVGYGTATAMATAAALENQTLRYAVVHAGVAAGAIKVVIEYKINHEINHEKAMVKTTSTSHPNLLASMFARKQTTETWFTWQNNRAMLQSGQLFATKTPNNIEHRFMINHHKHHIEFNDNKTTPIEATALLESTAFPLALMTGDMNALSGRTVQVISPEHARHYQYHTPQQETLMLNEVTYNTWQVTRHKKDDPTRSVRVYLDRDNHNIPVKIISTKRDKDTVMTLVNISS